MSNQVSNTAGNKKRLSLKSCSILPKLNRVKLYRSIRQVGITCQQQSQPSYPHTIHSWFDRHLFDIHRVFVDLAGSKRYRFKRTLHGRDCHMLTAQANVDPSDRNPADLAPEVYSSDRRPPGKKFVVRLRGLSSISGGIPTAWGRTAEEARVRALSHVAH